MIQDIQHVGSAETGVFPIDRQTWWIYIETSCGGSGGSRVAPDLIDGQTGKPIGATAIDLGDGPLNPTDPDRYEYPGGTFRMRVTTNCAWHMTQRG